MNIDFGTKAVVAAEAISELHKETTKFFALLVQLCPDKLEKFLLDAVEETKRRPHLMAEKLIAEKVEHASFHIIMLGCLERFKQDMIANHPYAKEANRQYEEKMDAIMKDLGFKREH